MPPAGAFRACVASVASLLLAACGGGGGGGGGSSPPIITPPVTSTTPSDPLVRVSSLTPFALLCDGSGQSAGLYPSAEVEPSIAVNPQNTNNLVGVWQQDRWSNGSARAIAVGASFDGGTTWQTRPMPFSHCGGGNAQNGGDFIRVSDPWVTFGADGIAYQVALSTSGGSFQAGSVNAVLVSRSIDGGTTWTNPTAVIVDGGDFFNDKDSITADRTDARFVYATWDRLPARTAAGPSYLARSIDRGVTWEPARPIYDPGAVSQTINNQIVVLTDGTVVDFFTQFDTGINGSVATSIGIVRSTDKGVTWSPRIKIADVASVGTRDPENGAKVRDATNLGSIAAGAQGSLHIAWQDSRANGGAHDDVLYARSLDGGLTWSAPVRINADPTVSAFTPTIAVRVDGTVGITYYDFRSNTASPETLLTDYWLARSDDGVNWREARVAAPFDLSIAPNAEGLFLGDYQSLATIGNVFVPFFAQTGGGDLSNRTDIWSVVARNGSVASGDVPVKREPVGSTATDEGGRSYRADRVATGLPSLTLPNAAHDSVVTMMEARVPGWNARRLRAIGRTR